MLPNETTERVIQEYSERVMQIPYARGYKISVSFSCPSEMLSAISETRLERRGNQSDAIQYLIRMGLIYLKVLEAQRLEQEEAPPEEPKTTKRTKKKKG